MSIVTRTPSRVLQRPTLRRVLKNFLYPHTGVVCRKGSVIEIEEAEAAQLDARGCTGPIPPRPTAAAAAAAVAEDARYKAMVADCNQRGEALGLAPWPGPQSEEAFIAANRPHAGMREELIQKLALAQARIDAGVSFGQAKDSAA